MSATHAPARTGHSDGRSAPGGRQQGDRRRDDHAKQGRRSGSEAPTRVELITLALSTLIVVALIGLTTYLHLTQSSAPVAVEVEPHLAEVYEAGGRFYLPLTIRNTGGSTGEDVRVRTSMVDGSGQPEAAEVMIPFLPGGGSSRAVATFASDPRQGKVSASAVSFVEP